MIEITRRKRRSVFSKLKWSVVPVFIFGFLFGACKKDSAIKPTGNNQAKPVYNQAYSENHDPDTIEDIVSEAKNAYVLVDPFMPGVAEKIPSIQANNNEVGGYISIGTGESWRNDFPDLVPFLVTTQWKEWEGEFFVKKTTTGILQVMKRRIDQLADWGCDWVEFDNMDWFFDEDLKSKYGIEVTRSQGIAYYQELCEYAHTKGLKCMAKNHVVEADNFDGVLYESYRKEKNWWDQEGAQHFLDAGKLVIINHYDEPRPNTVYAEYIDLYNEGVSYICESSKEKKYIHYNQ